MSVIQSREKLWDSIESVNEVFKVSSSENNVSIFTYGNGSATLKVTADNLQQGQVFDDLTWSDRFVVSMKNGVINSTLTEEGNYLSFIGDVKYLRFENVSGFTKIEIATY